MIPMSAVARRWLALAAVALLALGGLVPAWDAVADRPARKPRSDVHGQIVGGSPVPAGQFRFATMMEIGSSWGTLGCGASLISPDWALTAAHCVVGESARSITLWVGANDLDDLDTAERRGVSQLLIHPGYDGSSQANDAALMRLDRSVTTIAPIPLPASGASTGLAAGTELTVVGWGTTSSGGPTSDRLLQVNVPVTTDRVCEEVYGLGPSDIAVMFCAGRDEGGADSCQGDSGGPIFLQQGGTTTQIGVVSYGYGCADPGVPGVYTRLAAPVIRDWIASVTGSSPTPGPTSTPTPTPGPGPTATPTPGPSAPQVTMLRPWDGATKRRTVRVEARAVDDSGIREVEFWACFQGQDCERFDVFQSPPWYGTYRFPTGVWTVYAKATANDGGAAQSDPVTFRVRRR